MFFATEPPESKCQSISYWEETFSLPGADQHPFMSENFGMETKLPLHTHTHTRTCTHTGFVQLTDTYTHVIRNLVSIRQQWVMIVSNSNILLCLVCEVAWFNETQLIHSLQTQKSRLYYEGRLYICFLQSPSLCSLLKLTFLSSGLVMEMIQNMWCSALNWIS